MEFWDRFPSESEGMVSLSSTIWYCWWEVLTSSWISFLHGSPVHLNPSPSHKTFIFSSWPLTSEIPLWCVLMFPPPGCFHFSSSFLPALSPELLRGSVWQTGCLLAPRPLSSFYTCNPLCSAWSVSLLPSSLHLSRNLLLYLLPSFHTSMGLFLLFPS